MTDIKFSHLTNHPEAFGIERYEAQTRHRVHLQKMEWQTGWSEVLQIANFHDGPDVSEIGNTWVGSLAGMNAVRPFKPAEIARMGGAEGFLPAVWQANQIHGQDDVFAIPWYTGVRILAYRRDILAEAGIAEEGAFASAEALMNTLAHLQAAGVEIPWAMNTAGLQFHVVAPWIWGAGGHFRSADRRHLELASPQSIQGMLNYFKLGQYLAPAARDLDYWPSAGLLASGRAAVAVVESSFVNDLQYETEIAPGLLAKIGFTKLPGIPYVGSVSLIIWRHSIHDDATLELIRHLVSLEQQREYFRHSGNLPTQLAAFEANAFHSEALFRACYDSLTTGRSFMSSPFWAAIEARLNTLIGRLWQDLYADPTLNLEKEVSNRIRSLTDKLEKTLLAENR